MNAVDFAEMLKLRLPEGPAWPLSDVTDGDTAWDWLINALAQEPARLDDAIELLLNKVVPDNADTDLTAWEEVLGAPTEDLTDEERLARIRAILRFNGEIDRASLEAVVRRIAGDNDVNVFNRAWPNFEAGESNAGDSGGDSSFFWLVELYANALEFGPDAAWNGGTGILEDILWSPVTLATTATEVTTGVGLSSFAYAEVAAADDDDIRFSVWLRSATGTLTLEAYVETRDGLGDTLIDTWGLTEVWQRFQFEANVMAGATTPQIKLVAPSAVFYMSYALCAPIDALLEAEITSKFPLHTRGVFSVRDEYEVLKSQDPLEVSF